MCSAFFRKLKAECSILESAQIWNQIEGLENDTNMVGSKLVELLSGLSRVVISVQRDAAFLNG